VDLDYYTGIQYILHRLTADISLALLLFDEALKVLDFDRISQLFDKVVSNLDIPTFYVKNN
jgi:hypothetical protein